MVIKSAYMQETLYDSVEGSNHIQEENTISDVRVQGLFSKRLIHAFEFPVIWQSLIVDSGMQLQVYIYIILSCELKCNLIVFLKIDLSQFSHIGCDE